MLKDGFAEDPEMGMDAWEREGEGFEEDRRHHGKRHRRGCGLKVALFVLLMLLSGLLVKKCVCKKRRMRRAARQQALAQAQTQANSSTSSDASVAGIDHRISELRDEVKRLENERLRKVEEEGRAREQQARQQLQFLQARQQQQQQQQMQMQPLPVGIPVYPAHQYYRPQAWPQAPINVPQAQPQMPQMPQMPPMAPQPRLSSPADYEPILREQRDNDSSFASEYPRI